MTRNPVRQALRDRRLSVGSWIQIGHAASAEILARAGFEWVAIDMEHTDIDLRQMTDLARGMHGRGTVPFVRVRENDTLAIRQVLDAGAQGVIVPLVNSAVEAQHAVAAAKYPPKGVRGFCFSRMNDYGSGFEEYVRHANEDIAVVVMVESRQAVEQIDSILEVDGVDGVFIGPYDLSGSFGIPGQTSADVVTDACRRVLDACRAAGKSAGLHVVTPTPAAVCKAIEEGFTFVALGVDTVFLRDAAGAALGAARGLT
jgi:2-keto-3-deoxy-L-rhamnonate aldolase RhmA